MEPDQEKRIEDTALGSDPFADMDLGDEETAVSQPEPIPVNGGAEDAANALGDPEAKLMAEASADALEAALLGEDMDETAASTPPVLSEAEVLSASVPDGLPDLEAELFVEDDAVEDDADETPDPETAVPDDVDAGPEESRYLDDLIANIDDQIDALYGTEDSMDLSGEQTHIPGAEEQHVVFHLADTEYTVPIGNVTEIGRPLPTTIVPNVPGWMLGVANLRGDIVSMVDLRSFLGLPPAQFEQDGRMIIAQSTNEEVTAGLLVDRVSGIRFLTVEQITAPAAAIEDQVAPYLRGVYEDNGRLLVVLNLNKLLLSSEMQQFESV